MNSFNSFRLQIADDSDGKSRSCKKRFSYECPGLCSCPVMIEIFLVLLSGVALTVMGYLGSNEGEYQDSLARISLYLGMPASVLGIVILNLRLTVLRTSLILLLGVIIPLLNALLVVSEEYGDVFMGVFWVFYSILGFLFLLMRACKEFIKFRSRAGNLFVYAYVVIVFAVCFSLTYITGRVIFIEEFDKQFWMEVLTFCELAYLPFVFVVWNFLENAYFTPVPPQYEVVLEDLQNEQISTSFYERISRNKFLLWVNNYRHIISSQMLLVVALILDIMIFILALIGIVQEEDLSYYLVVAFFKLAVPLFMFLGFVYSGNRIVYDTKLSMGVIAGALFIVIGNFYGNELVSNGYKVLGYLICIGIPIGLLYWVCMVFVYKENKRCYHSVTPMICLGIGIPLGFLYPLLEEDVLSDTAFYVLMSISLLVFLAYTIALYIMDFALSLKANLYLLYHRVKLIEIGVFVKFMYTFMTLAGHFAITFLLYYDNFDSWESSVGVSSLILIYLAYFYSKTLNMVNLYKKSLPKYSLLDILTKQVEESEEFLSSVHKKRYIQLAVIVGGYFVPSLVLFILAIVYMDSNSSVLTTSVFLLIGLFFLTFFVLLFLQLKTSLRQFGAKFLPYGIAALWTFLVAPFFIVLPASFLISKNHESLGDTYLYVAACIVLLLIVGISCLSIYLNYIFKRLEKEKFAKYCQRKLTEIFRYMKIKVEDKIVRAIVDHYVELGSPKLHELLQGKCFIDEFELVDDPTFDKEIILVSKLKSRKGSYQKKTTREIPLYEALKQCLCKTKNYRSNLISPMPVLDSSRVMMDKKNPHTEIKVASFDYSIEEEHKQSSQENQEDLDLDENIPELENIQEVKLGEEEREELLAQYQFLRIKEHSPSKWLWLRTVFNSLFSHGRDSNDANYMNMNDIHQFIRLCGLKNKIPSVRIDLIFTKMTKKYDPLYHKVKYTKITVDDLEDLLLEISKCVYTRTQNDTLIEDYIYPNLVTLFPFLRNIIRKEKRRSTIKINENVIQIDLEGLEEEQLEVEEDNDQGFVRMMTIVVESKGCCRPLRVCISKTAECIMNTINKFFRLIGIISLFLFDYIFPTTPDKQTPLQDKSDEESVERTGIVDWETLCERTVELLDNLSEEWKGFTHTFKINKLTWNVANVVNISLHLLEVYVYTSVALAEEVNWSYFLESGDETSEVALAETSYWVELFIVVVCMAFVYIILVKPVSSLVRVGRLGLSKDLTKATFPHWQFFLEKIVVILGASLYLTIISGLLGVFSCVYIADEWVVSRSHDLDCYEGIYWLYFMMGFFGFVFYYPAATLLYPNIMYQNKSLDLKYDTTFLVFESQGKLMIAGASAFFARENYIYVHLCFVIAVCVALSVYTFIKQPCLVIPYNYWKGVSYFIPIWASACAIFNYYTSYKTTAFVLLVAGSFSIVVIAIIAHLIKRKKEALTSY